MRPLELELKGFTSFRSPTTVDFRDLDLFAITGPTGAGKSSLIDAMIYALYGRAPRLNREVNQLVSRGLDRMSVRLDFQVEKAVYRVVRTASVVKGKVLTKTVLEEGLGDQAKSVAGKAGDVETVIAELIGLDYDSFIRSVVLPQGEFDAFLIGEPKERQKILHHLLRMGIYGDMQRLAYERGAAERAEAEAHARLLAELAGATPEALHACREEGAAIVAEQGGASERAEALARAAELAGELVQALGEEQAARATAERIGRAIAAGAERLRVLARAAEQRDAERVGLVESLAATPYDPDRHLELEKAEAKAEEWRRLAAAIAKGAKDVAAAAKRAAELEAAMKMAAGRVAKATQASAERKVECARAQGQEAALRERYGSAAQLSEHAAAAGRWRKAEAERAAKESALTKMESEAGARREQHAKAERELATLRARVGKTEEVLLALRRRHAAHELRSALERGVPCPVCEQEVKTLPRRRGAVGSIEEATAEIAKGREQAEKAAAAVARLEAEIEGEEKRRAELTRDARTLTKEAALLLKQLTTYLAAPPDALVEATLREVQAEIERTGRAARAAEAALAAADRAASEAAAARDQLALEQSAETHRLATAERTRQEQAEKAAELAHSLAALVGAPADDRLLAAFGALLSAMRAAKAARARAEAKLAELDRTASGEREEEIALASARQAEERERAAAAATAAEAARRVADLRRSLLPRAAELGLALVESPTGEAEVRALADQQAKLAGARMDLVRRQALAEARAREIESQIAKRAELETVKARAEGRARLHAILDRDLKRDGFPAYLLEEALARLAADANRQLDNFPNATFSLAVEGQDFTIIDHANADERRSVRTLSGGESFIASLALAMAFAETLAALAGSSNVTATLESLFLDEGFGTLDAENLDAVAGGLEALTSRTRMVGVVTHIPELAHRLPARIVVSKRGNASEVTVDSA